MEISIIIPVYNESRSIEKTICTIKEDLHKTDISYEIIAVDDCSDDGTSDILVSMQNKDIRIFRNDINRGYGYSIKRGVRHSKYKNIFITDADSTYPNHQMSGFIKRFYQEELDMLIGRRERQNIPLIRKPAKFLLRMFAQYFSGHNIPDLNSGFRIFRKEIALKYINMLPDGFSLTSTITIASLSDGCDVRWESIEYNKRSGNSKIRPIRDTL
ncbi:MAG: glycosyltransferase family 2 protein, partial [Candidatus Muiribacteriaceae bacterium]